MQTHTQILKNADSAIEKASLLNELAGTATSLHYYKITAQNAFFKNQERVEVVPAKDQQTAVNDFLSRVGRLFNVVSCLQLA
jgi:hypothetical protein